jgi:hypothetical protein
MQNPTANHIVRSSKLGIGCLGLFALPFAGVGVFAAVMAVRKATAAQWREAGMLCLFALVFGGVGFGLLIAGFFGTRKLKQDQAREQQFPDEPWRWRDDWASGHIVSSNRNTMWGAWIFAILWNGISSMVWFALPQELEKGNKAAFIGLIFPAIGLGLLVWAVRATIRWRKFGAVTFELTRTPVLLGGEISGLITTSGSLADVRVVKLQVACIQHEQRGKNSSQRLLWEDRRELDAAALHLTTGIPVFFQLPREGTPTSPQPGSVFVKWQLAVRAETAGVDFGATFELPVFGVAPADSYAAPFADPTARWQSHGGESSPNPTSRIRVETTAEGKEFIFPAARNIGVALWLTLFVAIFSAALWLTIVKQAPIIFPIVLGLFDFLFVLLMFSAWFSASRIVIAPDGLQRHKSGLLLRSQKKFLREEIKDLKLHIGMTSGTKAFYDLRVITVFGREATIASSISDKREAEWLAHEMKTALGLSSATAPNLVT